MKILFVQAMSMEDGNPMKVYPIGVVTLATHAKRSGFEVEILDLNMQLDPYGALKSRIQEYQPEVVAVSLRNIDPLANKTSSLVPPFKIAVKFIRAMLPDVPIIAGGTGFSLFPERLMSELPEIDFGIAGEADESFMALLHALNTPQGIPGVIFREGSNLVQTPPSRHFDMRRQYVPADRDLLDPKPYLTDSYVPAIGIETQRGCPFNCAYCVYPALQGHGVRAREVDDILDEIELLHRKFGVTRLHLNDPAVNMIPGHLESICEGLLRRDLKISWGGFFRENMLDNIELFARSGCECFAFSPDGLTDTALDFLEKGISIDDIIHAAEVSSKTDVISIYHFMVNLPNESESTVKSAKDLISKLYEIHKPRRNLGTIILNNMRIMPGTKIADFALQSGEIGADTDLLYPAYFNPKPHDILRYELEEFQQWHNVCMWQEII